MSGEKQLRLPFENEGGDLMARSDEEYAELAARHGYGEDLNPRQTLNRQTGKSRQDEFSEIGVKSQTDAKNLCAEIRKSEDTSCFRAPDGREVYANDRLKALHYSNEQNPEKSTIFPNNDLTREPVERLNDIAQAERDRAKEQGIDAPCVVRPGGSKALEQDRPAATKSVEVDRTAESTGTASRPRDQEQVLKEAQDQQRETPDQELSPDQEQIALKANIEKADFDRHAAPERAELAIEENGPQSIDVLKAKREGREAEAVYEQGVADWHKNSVRDSEYERYDDKWSKEAEIAEEREANSNETQAEKDAALDRQFDASASKSFGHDR